MKDKYRISFLFDLSFLVEGAGGWKPLRKRGREAGEGRVGNRYPRWQEMGEIEKYIASFHYVLQ